MSKIQWTDATWNPVTGCSKVSAGCKNCYAERDWPRVYGGGAPAAMRKKYGVRKFTDVLCHHDRLDQPLRWRKPRMVFVNSMADLFHEDVPGEFIRNVFGVMHSAPRHAFQVLTKRPERMRGFLRWFVGPEWRGAWPHEYPHVWLGVSCEDQKTADERIPILLDTPAAVRFVSAEPLIGPIEFSDVTKRRDAISQLGKKALDGIDWVIVGGESGPKARPCDVAWIRSVVDQCRATSVPCFVKQLGANVGSRTGDECTDPRCRRGPDDWCPVSTRDRKGGDPSEWPEDLRVREWPKQGPG